MSVRAYVCANYMHPNLYLHFGLHFKTVVVLATKLPRTHASTDVHMCAHVCVLIHTQTLYSNALSVVLDVIKTHLLCLLTQTYLCFSALITFSISMLLSTDFTKVYP